MSWDSFQDNISKLIYTPLMEEADVLTGWDKQTVEYVQKNKSKIEKDIRTAAKTKMRRPLQKHDVDEIYQNIVLYMYKADDYNLKKAYERSDGIPPLQGYVNNIVTNCVQRYISEKGKVEKNVIGESIRDEDDKEMSLFDTIADPKSSKDEYFDIPYDLDALCKTYESQRYRYGVDIFEVWFVQLQLMVNEKQDLREPVFELLGISKTDLGQADKETSKNDMMMNIAKAITVCDNEGGMSESINILRKYTYAANKIEQAIKAL